MMNEDVETSIRVNKGGTVSGSAFEYELPAINYCRKTLSLN